MSDPLATLAESALSFVSPGTIVGLGTGRAAGAFIRALGERVAGGLMVRGVPTSEASARLAVAAGVPLVGFEAGELDTTFDGADEVDPDLNLIKGFGGAMARERVVACASRRQVILVDESKLVQKLGRGGRLPVEVVPFALVPCLRAFERAGLAGTLRHAGGEPFVTDNGNRIVDCSVPPIDDPVALHESIRAIPGVLDTGLFLGTAHVVLIAGAEGVRKLERESGTCR